MIEQVVNILLVEENTDTSKLIEENLLAFDQTPFTVTCVRSGEEALRMLDQRPAIDVIITDYYLTGMNGLEFARIVLRDNKSNIPVIFLTTNKDMYLIIEVMKLGVKDYLFKENITTSILPQTLLSHVAKRRLKQEVDELEVKQRRLDAMQEIVVQISREISDPLDQMKGIVGELIVNNQSDKAIKYLQIIKENVDRMELKMEKLKNLKDDKTVQYIKDIRMIDIS